MRTVAASILCFAKKPDNTTVFLLGRECKYNKRTTEKSIWSDFGGKAESETEQPEDIASREFCEETAGMVAFFRDPLEANHQQNVRASLVNKEYIKRYDFRVSDSTCYTTFVCQIPYQDLARFDAFQRMVLQLKSMPQHPAYQLTFNSVWLEKTELRWFSLSRLALSVEQQGVLDRASPSQKSYLAKYFYYRLAKVLQEWPEKVSVNWRTIPRVFETNNFENFNRRRKDSRK